MILHFTVSSSSHWPPQNGSLLWHLQTHRLCFVSIDHFCKKKIKPWLRLSSTTNNISCARLHMLYRSSVSLWTMMALGRLPVFVEMEKLYCYVHSCIWDKFSVNSKWEIISKREREEKVGCLELKELIITSVIAPQPSAWALKPSDFPFVLRQRLLYMRAACVGFTEDLSWRNLWTDSKISLMLDMHASLKP